MIDSGIAENPAASFWEQNIAILRSRYPDLAKQIKTTGTLPERHHWDIEQTPSGNPTLLFKENNDAPGVLIHSRHDPAREGQRQAAAALAELTGGNTGEGGTIILLGFGLGYTAEALAKTIGALIIVERHTELFSLAMESRNLEQLLSPGKAMFVMGEDAGAINAALSIAGNDGQKPLVIKNRALTTVTPEDTEWYNEVTRRINTWASKEEINAATLRRFGKRWTRNLAANMEGVLRFPGVKYLENILRDTGIPVFLAAAGPSLNSVEHILEEIRRRCVIVAVDTSLRFLLRHGIEPDFAVSVDPQYWNSLHLQRLNAPNTNLVAESAVYPSILRSSSFGRIFFCQSLFPLGRFIEDRTDPKGMLGAGGSVATTAWDFARLLGPGAVWIAGLDLAFPGYHTHFRGALFEENAHAASGRFCPAETLSVRALENGVPFTAVSASGGKVLTDKRLSLYAAWFENQIQKYDPAQLTNYSLSPNGIAVPGLVNADVKELLSMPERRNEIDPLLKKLYGGIEEHYKNDEVNRKNRYTESRNILLRSLEEIRETAVGAASAAKNGLMHCTSNKNETEKILKKLDKANDAITQSPVKDAAGFLFTPIAELEKQQRETEPLKRHLEFSRLFYHSLEESVEYTLGVLNSRVIFTPSLT